MCQQFHYLPFDAELGELVGGRSDEDISPMQVTMFKFKLLLSDSES